MNDQEQATIEAARHRFRKGTLRAHAIRERAAAMQMAVAAGSAGGVGIVGGRKVASNVVMVPTSRTFPAADRHRLRATPSPYSGLADNFLTGYNQRKLKEECRQAKRRFTLAKSMCQRMAQLAIADGLILKMTSSDADYNAAAKAYLENWLAAPTTKGRGRSMTQALWGVVNEWMCGGDMGWIWTDQGSIQEIESERIMNPGGWASLDTSNCIGGVEIDDGGKPVALWIQSRVDALSGYNGTSPMGVVRVDAEHCYFSVNPVDQEVGQTRGLPAIASAVPLIELLETYVEDQARAAKMATFLGYVFKTESGVNPFAEFEQDAPNPGAGAPSKEIELQTGYSVTLGPTESVSQMHPEYPTPYAREFASLVGMQASASVGLPLILVLLDPSQTNFHGFKSAIAVAFRQIAFMQTVVIDMFQWACRRKLSEALFSKQLALPRDDKWDAMHVIAPSLPTPDFGADVDAHIKAVQANLETAETATQQLGTGDAADIRSVREIEVKDEKTKNITPVVAGAAVVQKGIPK